MRSFYETRPKEDLNRTFIDFLSEKDRETLFANATRKQYSDGEKILGQGDKNTSVYLIDKGEVSIVSRHMDFELEVQRLHVNDIIGEMSFVDTEPVSTDVVAVGDVEMSIIDRETLERILRTDPLFYGRFFHAISKTLALRLRANNEKVSQFQTDF